MQLMTNFAYQAHCISYSLCLNPPSLYLLIICPWCNCSYLCNSHKENTNEIILDMCPTPFENMREYLKLENMINPPEKIDETSESSTTGDSEVRLVKLTMKNQTVSIKNEGEFLGVSFKPIKAIVGTLMTNFD